MDDTLAVYFLLKVTILTRKPGDVAENSVPAMTVLRDKRCPKRKSIQVDRPLNNVFEKHNDKKGNDE
uniref:Uncharacterized protein n=1 Tax=Romanomermis culicivorax TaxID=13658 RepID=A0A915JLS2_ROMCU